ncbi:DUF3313 domain-containing protein [Escherichia coli]|nr:DUF3313 domain-containing protein [Escherichia coli]
MRTTSFAKVAALCGLLALSGCASKITQPDKYSGFLNNYSDLKETTVDSICQCNTPFNYLFRCFELQCLSRSVV